VLDTDRSRDAFDELQKSQVVDGIAADSISVAFASLANAIDGDRSMVTFTNALNAVSAEESIVVNPVSHLLALAKSTHKRGSNILQEDNSRAFHWMGVNAKCQKVVDVLYDQKRFPLHKIDLILETLKAIEYDDFLPACTAPPLSNGSDRLWQTRCRYIAMVLIEASRIKAVENDEQNSD
jgi:hypothetical protein